jgi:hypothetical protein
MDKTTETRFDIPKEKWPPGPWHKEPDRLDFEHAGLPCLALRNHFGVWCGYAAVPPGHRLHGQHYDGPDVTVHGGLTYAGPCSDSVCHTPKPGEPDNVWWFGFDCGHGWDLTPANPLRFGDETYRDLAYVRHEIERLAEQLAAPQAIQEPAPTP